MTDLITLYRQVEDYFFRAIALEYRDLADGAMAYMTCAAELNFISITRNTHAFERLLLQGKQFFDQESCSFDVSIPEELCRDRIRDVLHNMGYFQKCRSVAMALNLEEFESDVTYNYDVAVRIKAMDDRLTDWVRPLVSAFASTSEVCAIYAACHASALKKKRALRHFSLCIQETPITSITLSMLEGSIARIDDLGTLTEFQGKGYATLLMRYVLAEAQKLGAHYCFLEASESGIKIYEKLKFKPLFINTMYSSKA